MKAIYMILPHYTGEEWKARNVIWFLQILDEK